MKAKIIKISLLVFKIDDKSNIEKLSKRLVRDLTEYCTTENNLLEVYRLLRRIRYTILINKNQHPQHECQCDYLLYIIDTEIEINRLKTEHSDLRIKIPKLLKWTDTFNALIELIYGTQNLSINFGKGKLEEIAACFEFIFQIKLGNISEKFGDMCTRKPKKMYIDRIKENLFKKMKI
ncbi:RteC domain-containing protein [Dysgonomonas termitidis]|uniref:RteC domain-containing protein n=1 Tax=Dysgonomonas termitidis TaxID=1516126 RepID=A0ABV9L073_9BACT